MSDTPAKNQKIKVRFPPSPTGEWHFGNVRTFVFNYLFTKKIGGEIVLRFEDTDTARNKPGADLAQIEILNKLGLHFDEGPYYQSARGEIYKKELKRLLDEGKVYEAEENQAGTGKIIRIKNTERNIIWEDLIKGTTKISSHSFKDDKGNSDFIIARSINDPLYHFAVVVDDWLMNITHVLRGEDHVTSTPRQIIILEALGANVPQYGHFPTILGENKKKLGKRNGAVPVREYIEKGYAPDALLNAISLLGWNPGTDQEIFSKDELIEAFSLQKVQHHPAIFYGDKLNHINKEHLNKLSADEYKTELLKYVESYFDARSQEKINSIDIDKLIGITRDRINYFGELKTIIENDEIDFIFSAPKFNAENVQVLICSEKMSKNGQGEKITVTAETTKNILSQVREILISIDEANWTQQIIKDTLWPFAEHEGRGVVLWPMRVALSGKEKSPDPFSIAEIIGKEDALQRLTNVIEIL